MTYREDYAAHPAAALPPDRVHLLRCPADCPGNLECVHPQLMCRACWDREMETMK